SAAANQIVKRLEETRPARLWLQLRRGQRGIRSPQELEPERHDARLGGLGLRQTARHGAADGHRRRAFVETEKAAREVGHGVEGEQAPVGASAGIVKRHTAGALGELVTQAALPGARLRGDQNDLRSTRLRLAERLLEQGQLARTAHEARKAAGARALEATPDRTGAPQVEYPHGSARALEALLPPIEEIEEARDQPSGLLGHADTARRGQLLHSGGEPDHVALRGVVHAQVVAYSPDHD